MFVKPILKYLPLVFFVCSALFLARALFLDFYPDFSTLYYGPQVLLSGRDPYLEIKPFFTPYVYPPFVLIAYLPLSLFPLVIVSKFWVGLSIILLIASFYLMFKMFKQKLLEPTNLLLTGLIFFTFFPIKFTLGMGQINILIFFLFILSVYLYNRKREQLSGIILALPLLLKLFPVLLVVYFAVKKRWKFLSGMILTFVIMFLLSLIFIKFASYFYFFQTILPDLLTGWKSDYYNQSLSGFLSRQFSEIEPRNTLKILLTIGLIMISMFSLFKTSKNIYSENLKIGIIVSVSLLINTFSWQHHFVWILFPILTTWFYLRKTKAKFVYFLVLFICYFLVALNMKNPSGVPLIIQSHVFFGALMLWLFNIYLLYKPPASIRG